MALSPLYLAKHTGKEIDEAVDKVATLETQIGNAYVKPTNGIPETDLAGAVQASLGLADTAVQSAGLTAAIEALDVVDEAVAGKYVSAVSETDGKISVTRADLPEAYNDEEIKENITKNTDDITAINTAIADMDLTDTAVDGEYVSSVSQTDGKITVTRKPLPEDKDTQYTFAEGTVNGAFSVTPDGGTAQSVPVHGLGSAAYTPVSDYATATQGDKADSALQKADIATGAANGNISVKGTDVPVKGLGSAAFTDSTAYDAAGAAAAVDTKLTATQTELNDLKDTVDSLTGGSSTLGDRVTAIEGKIPTTASATNKLVDTDTMNSSIANSAARFIAPTANGGQFASLEALQNGTPAYYHAGVQLQASDLTNHDYAIFMKTIEGVEYQFRAGYEDGTWSEQYKVGSALTANQTAALNSGITEEGVTQITTNTNDIAQLKTDVANRYTKGETDTKISQAIAAIPATPAATTEVAGIAKLGAAGGSATFESVQGLLSRVAALEALLSQNEYDIMFVKKATAEA